jgi:hypothetical protein
MGSHKHCQDPACFCVDTVPAKDERRVKVGDVVVNLCPDPLNLFAVAGSGFRVTSATDESFVAYAGAHGMTRQRAARGKTWDFADAEKPQSLAESLVGVDSEREAARADNERAASECGKAHPWDGRVRCKLPSGHEGGCCSAPTTVAVGEGLPQPAPDGLTERERGAWELYRADRSILKLQRVDYWSELSREWQENYLAVYDRAEQLFAEKHAQSVRDWQATIQAVIADKQRLVKERDHANAQAGAWARYVEDVDRLTARNAELVKALRWHDKNPQVHSGAWPCSRWRPEDSKLMARIDAETTAVFSAAYGAAVPGTVAPGVGENLARKPADNVRERIDRACRVVQALSASHDIDHGVPREWERSLDEIITLRARERELTAEAAK